MMHQKALLFDDRETAVKIMDTVDPAEIKALGRQVKNFDSAVWRGRAQIIVYRGLMAKFESNALLVEKLIGTGDALLVECARGDRLWACGLAMDDPARFDLDRWKGRNLLGFALMEVRARLRFERERPAPVAAIEKEREEAELERVNAEIAEREAKYLDACQGCLIGGAVGDALGYAVEFKSRDSILRKYGPAGITKFELDARSGLALVSDDTQMTLFTGMGYLVGLTRYSLRGIGGPEDHIRNAYLSWLDTQEKSYDECLYDMMSIFLRARNFDASKMKKGDILPMPITDAKHRSDSWLIYRGKENYKIEGTSEKFRCLVFSFIEREDGKETELIKFFITDDDNHMPVRLDMNLSFGSAKVYLRAYQGIRNPLTSKLR